MNRMDSRVAIVGGSGFIGAHVAKGLAARGGHVTVFDLKPPQADIGASFRSLDITAKKDSTDWNEFDAVVIAAGLLAGACAAQPRLAWEVNVAGTLRIIDAIQRSERPSRVVFLSSGMVYDATAATPPFTESAPVSARCAYRASKLTVESALAVAAGGGSLRALVLRPFTVFGSGMSGIRGHLLGRWLELGKQGEPLTVYGSGDQVVDAVPVEYVAEASAAWLRDTSAPAFSVVNVTSGAPLRVARLAELMVQAGRAAGIVRLSANRPDESRGWGSISALRRLLARDLPADPEYAVREFLSGAV
jgi:nucleoside-diphosphate-sugar epimerase